MGYLMHLTLANKIQRHAMPAQRIIPILLAVLLSSSLAQAAAPARPE
jgi:hypothetical protein